jgi:nascent polypeptide-associated complex subunit beta
MCSRIISRPTAAERAPQQLPLPVLIQSAVHASVPSNTFAIYGHGEDKELTELVPGILNQLGPDSLASLRKLAESYQSMQKEKGEDGDKKDDDDEDDDDDDIPELVAGDNFESKTEVE